ncbi:MAG: DUF4089 domain-containing protein [Thermostichales cyanobacterium GMQP_bins_62]
MLAYARAVAARLDVDIGPYEAEVVRQLQRLEGLAAPLMAFPLADDWEPACDFEPLPGRKVVE